MRRLFSYAWKGEGGAGSQSIGSYERGRQSSGSPDGEKGERGIEGKKGGGGGGLGRGGLVRER
jgi:hypothetical protein